MEHNWTYDKQQEKNSGNKTDNPNGNIIRDKKLLSNIFNKYFCGIWGKLAAKN